MAEAGGGGEEEVKLLLAALQDDPQGPGEDQAEQLHEALAVDPVLAVVQADRKRLGGGYSYKLFHIPDRAKAYHKIFGIFHLALYKPFRFVYNGGRIVKLPINCIISNLPENAIVALDDSNNISGTKLAVITNENQFLYTGMQNQPV